MNGVVGRRTDIGASSLPYSTLTRIVLRRGTGKLPGAGERKEAPRSVAKGRATDERSDASNFILDSEYLQWWSQRIEAFSQSACVHPLRVLIN